jgi:hypothetical protein
MSDVYVLLKDLPFVKAGTEYIKNNGEFTISDRTSYLPNKTGMKHERFAIHSDYVENNSEWFQKKDLSNVFSIIELLNNHNEVITRNVYTAILFTRAEEGNVEKGYSIYSVKRIGDNVTFKVKDKVRYDKEDEYCAKWRFRTITSFSILDGDIFINNHNVGLPWVRVSNWVKWDDCDMSPTEKTYTEKELLDAEEKAFNAGRRALSMEELVKKYQGSLYQPPMSDLRSYKFDKFSDYKNSQK